MNDNGIKQQVKSCHICHGPKIQYVFSAANHRIIRCADCGLIFLSPQIVDSACLQDKGTYQKHPFSVENDYLSHLRRSCTTAKAKMVDISHSRDAEWPGQEIYDLVTVANTLEYVVDPMDFLAKVHKSLKQDGIVALVIPTVDLALGRRKNAAFRLQNTYFDRLTIQTALLKSGFQNVLIDSSHTSGKGEKLIAYAKKNVLREKPLLSVIVPAFNEAATFGHLMEILHQKELGGVEMEIIIVESNSSDGTRQIALKYGNHPNVKLILEDKPQGKGHAVRAGLSAATGDYILIQDADLEYDIEDYDALVEPLVAGRAAFVLGSRHGGRSVLKMRQFSGQAGLSMYLNVGHWFFTALINILFFQRLRDPFTMFKVFRRDCLYGLEFKCNRFDFDYELLIKLIRKGYRPIELPVNYRSRSFKEGKKVRMFRDPISWLKTLLWLRCIKVDPLAKIRNFDADK